MKIRFFDFKAFVSTGNKIDFIPLLPLSVIFIYNLIFFNRFYPITEGWFSTYAWLFNNGKFPYSDFYFFLTPFYLQLISLFTLVFGYSFLFLRIFGIIIILLMTYFLFKSLRIIFGSSISAFVTIVGVIYYQSNNAHITYDFIQIVSLFGIIQGYLLLKYLDSKERDQLKFLLFAGLFGGLVFLTKQSNGLMISAFSLIGVLFISFLTDRKNIVKVILSYSVGFFVPLSITFFWLLLNSAFLQFSQQIFSQAVVAKGGLSQIFFSWFKGILTYNFFVRFKEIFLLFIFFGYWIYFFSSKSTRRISNSSNYLFIGSSFTFLLAIILPFFLNKETISQLSFLGITGVNNIIVAAISAPVILIIISIILFSLKKSFDKKLFLFSFISLGFIYGTGTSAGITEVGAFLGFCLFVGLMLKLKSFLGFGRIFIILFCLSFSLMLIEAKYQRPYFWWNADSPDIRAELKDTEKIKILRGIYTSAENLKLVNEVTEEIVKNSNEKDSVLTFPNIPIFYLLSNRTPPGKAVVYWFDFLPDSLALKEAELIEKSPPKVIVYLDLGPTVWEAHERLFRDGKPSGQRKINEAIKEVIKGQEMHVTKKYKLDNGVDLTVWAR